MWLVAFFKSKTYDEYSGALVYDPNLFGVVPGQDFKSKWRKVAVELKGKVRMGEVWSHSLTENLPKLYDVTKFPTILCFPAGDKSDPNTFEKYEGVITTNDIVSYALEKLNGKLIGKYIC